MPRKIRVDVDAAQRALPPGVQALKLNDDDTLDVTFDSGVSFLITITEDYPRGDSFYWCEATQESGPVAGNVDKILNELSQKSGGARAASVAADAADSGMGMHESSSQGPHAFGAQDSSNFFEADSNPVHPDLERDVAFAKEHGFRTEVERVAIGMRVTVYATLVNVSEQTGKAWGFQKSEPIAIQARFERPEYTHSQKMPEIFVLQNGKPCRFGNQLRNMLKTYLEGHWNYERGWVPPKQTRSTDAAESQSSIDDGAKEVAEALRSFNRAQQEVFYHLRSRGYNDDICAIAASQTTNCQQAERMCESGQIQDPNAAKGETVAGQTSSWLDTLKAKNNAKANADDDPNKFTPFKPDTEGWLVHLVKYVRKRTPTAMLYCVTCDKSHLVGAGMLRPSVCERDLCVYRFQQLKMGTDAADTVATGGGVIDMLICMFRATVESARAEMVLNPYPSVAGPDGKLVFDPKKRDLAHLRKVVAQLPESKDILGVENMDQLNAKLTAKDPILLPLMEWVISSNKSFMNKLRPEQCLKRLGTKQQFILTQDNPEREQKFKELKAKHGSKFAWHGSSLENWHAILRVGLKNCSNTPLMTAGAALGAGVYLAPAFQTSWGYCRGGQLGTNKDKKEQEGDTAGYFDGAGGARNIVCICLVEVINGMYNDHGWAWTVTKEEALCTRFFFVFQHMEDAAKAQSTPETKDPTFHKEIEDLVTSMTQ